jgi:hypothetical protein
LLLRDVARPALATVFIVVAGELNVCAGFLSRKEQIDADLARARTNYSQLNMALTQFEKGRGLRVDHELTAVFQRLTRYGLLLTSYRKYLSPTRDVDEFDRATTALRLVDECVRTVNAGMNAGPLGELELFSE